MDTDPLMTVGDVADLAGLTVRTLHHWDAIGLLVPSERSGAGHRRYGRADRERLFRVLALRSLGLPLGEIAAALDAGADLRGALERQAEAVRGRLAVQQELLAQLEAVLARLDAGAGLRDDHITDLIGVMRMEQHYSPDQLEVLRRRREDLGEGGMVAVQEEWPQVLAAVEAEKEAGTDPQDPRVQALATRYAELVVAFTGGDRAMLDAMQRAREAQGQTHDDSPIGREIGAHIDRAHGAG